MTGGIIDDRSGRITGVTTKDGRRFTAPIVVAADGNSSPVAKSMGLLKDAKKPMGVAGADGAYESALEVLSCKAPEQAERKLEVMDASEDGAIEKFAAALKAAL